MKLCEIGMCGRGMHHCAEALATAEGIPVSAARAILTAYRLVPRSLNVSEADGLPGRQAEARLASLITLLEEELLELLPERGYGLCQPEEAGAVEPEPVDLPPPPKERNLDGLVPAPPEPEDAW